MFLKNKTIVNRKTTPLDVVHGTYASQLFGVLTGFPLRETIILRKPPEFDDTNTAFITAGCKFTHRGDFSAHLPAAQKYRDGPIMYALTYVLQLESVNHAGVPYRKPAGGIVIVGRPDVVGCAAECTYGLSWDALGAVTLLAREIWVANSFRGTGFLDREVMPNKLHQEN